MTTSPETTPKPVVVGIDGSDRSAVALQWGAAYAREIGAPLSAISAWTYPAAMMMPAVGSPALPADDFERISAGRLDATVDATPTDPPVTDRRVVMGSPRSVLTEATDEASALVLGRTGLGRLTRLWLGSTASYCVRHAECPVVIVHESPEPEGEIIVAVDGSPASLEALKWALGFGPRHTIRAVYAHDEWELDQLGLESELRATLDAKAGESLNSAVLQVCKAEGVDPDRVLQQVYSGDPRTTVVDQADPKSILVLGAQGHSGLARFVLGSLADYAVHHAPGTVAIVR